MQVKTHSDGMGSAVNAALATAMKVTITLLSGEKLRAYEPIIAGPDYMSFNTTVNPTDPVAFVRWVAIACITVAR